MCLLLELLFQNAPVDTVLCGQQEGGTMSSTPAVNGDVGVAMVIDTSETLVAEGHTPLISNKDIRVAEKENINGSLSSEWTGTDKNCVTNYATPTVDLEISDEVKSVVNGMTVEVANSENDVPVKENISGSVNSEGIINVKQTLCSDGNVSGSTENALQVAVMDTTDSVLLSESESVAIDATKEIEPSPTLVLAPPSPPEATQISASDQSVQQKTLNETGDRKKNVETEKTPTTEGQSETEISKQTAIVEKCDKTVDMKSMDTITNRQVKDEHLKPPVETKSKTVDKQTESSIAEKPVLNRTVPKARKSCQSLKTSSSSPLPSSIIKTVTSLPIANMTFNLPDIESALDLGNRTLDNTKLTKKGKSLEKKKEAASNTSDIGEHRMNELEQSTTESNACSEDSNGRCDDDSVVDPEEIDVSILSTELSTTNDLLPSKARPKKRRKKMGTYNLPNEKKKSYKRKKEREEHSSDLKSKSSRTKVDEPELNNSNMETGDSADDTVSNCSTNNNDVVTNDKPDSLPEQDQLVDPVQCSVKTEKKSVMEVLTQNSHLAFSLGKRPKSLLVNRKSPKSELVQQQSRSIVHFMKSNQQDKSQQQVCTSNQESM